MHFRSGKEPCGTGCLQERPERERERERERDVRWIKADEEALRSHLGSAAALLESNAIAVKIANQRSSVYTVNFRL